MKKKKILLIVIPIVVVLIIAAAIVVLYFTTDLFKSNTELFWKYLSQSSDIVSIIQNDKADIQSTFKQNNTYSSSGILSYIHEQGENSSKQLNISTTSRHDVTTGNTYADATLKNGDLNLLQVSYVNSGNVYAIECQDIFPNYVGLRNSGLKELATKYGIDATNIPDSIDFDNNNDLLSITDEQKQHIADTYLPVITANIAENQYTKTSEQIQFNGTVYNANVYGVEVTAENMKQIILDCLNTLKTDTETLVLISNKLSALGFGIDYTDISNLPARIDELISEIQSWTTNESKMDIYVYENDGETLRVVIEIDEEMEITYDRISGAPTLTIDMFSGDSLVERAEESRDTYANDTVYTQQSIANVESFVDSILANQEANEMTSEIAPQNSSGTVDETQTTNEIPLYNLDSQSEESSETSIFRIQISKRETENQTTNTIQILPDANDDSISLNIEISLGNIQDNNINNSFYITLNNATGENPEATTISYSNNIVRTDLVDEIPELNNSNTAIANNYSAEQFGAFIESWVNLFSQNFAEKLAILGFENN